MLHSYDRLRELWKSQEHPENEPEGEWEAGRQNKIKTDKEGGGGGRDTNLLQEVLLWQTGAVALKDNSSRDQQLTPCQ